MSEVIVFATTGSEGIAEDVCKNLKPRLHRNFQPSNGILLGKTTVERFSNENIQVQVENVRGKFVVVIHSQVPPVNENLIELFCLLDAIKNSRPADVMVVFPYMPYSRSDQKNQPRISTMGCVLPKILNEVFEIRNVILLDPHSTHIKHYFRTSADEISAIYLMADHIENIFFPKFSKEKCVIVFADNGAAKRYGKLPMLTKLPVAYIDKNRPDDKERPDFNGVVGDVTGKICIIIDDEILTGGTSIGDAQCLINEGAESVFMFAIHPVLADKKMSNESLMKKLDESPIAGFVLTDSIPVKHKAEASSKFEIIRMAPLLAESIRRTVEDISLTDLHKYSNVNLYRP